MIQACKTGLLEGSKVGVLFTPRVVMIDSGAREIRTIDIPLHHTALGDIPLHLVPSLVIITAQTASFSIGRHPTTPGNILCHHAMQY